jgi:Holliday junction resolvase
MVDPREKGARGETQVRDMLRKLTGLTWERTPGSGALDPKHMLKGDLYIPNANNLYCVEVKNYEEDHISSKLLTSKSPQLLEWWSQAVRQGGQVSKKPLLIFKFNRSKMFVAYNDMPSSELKNLLICDTLFVSLLEEWIISEKPRFV